MPIDFGRINDIGDPADKIMLEFEHLVNNHPMMNVRMRWVCKSERKTGMSAIGEPLMFVKGNDPDYWLGVAYAAYKQKVVPTNQMKDVLLALKARGAKSDYYQQIVKEVLGAE